MPCGDCASAIIAVAANDSTTTTVAVHNCLTRLISCLLLQVVRVSNRAKTAALLTPSYVVAVADQLKNRHGLLRPSRAPQKMRSAGICAPPAARRTGEARAPIR